MTDEELCARLRECATWFDDIAAADRIEALVKERNIAQHQARMRKRFIEEARDERDRAEARAERLDATVRELIDHTHNCEKKLTEELHHADFCGESLPLTNARAALEGAKP